MNIAKGRRIATCIYCNQRKPITDDHVVPDCLFPKPQPPGMRDLITVPACDDCQLALSKHQDYLRDVLVTDHFASHNASAQKLLNGKVIRAVRSNRSAHARAVMSKSQWKPLHTPGGIYLQHLYTVPLEEERLVYLFTMIVKGLYYSYFKKRLPDDCLIEVHTTHPVNRVKVWNDFVRIFSQKEGMVGPITWGDVFACTFIYAVDEPAITEWRLLFYTSYVVLISTRPPYYDADFIRIGNNNSASLP